MDDSLLRIAERVIAKANAQRPADGVLRDELRSQRGLSRDDGAEISEAVFSYYRWFGWLNPQQPAKGNIEQALTLARNFRAEPQGFDDRELIDKSVPAWTKEELEVSAPFARALQSEPRLWLRAKRGFRDEVARRLRYCAPVESPLLPEAMEYTGTVDLFRTQEFQEGMFELQDIASQAVGIICAPHPKETWWDACAGEGGKTLHFSDLMQNKGLIWASDRAEWRLKKLKQRAARAQAFNYRTAHWDGGNRLPTKTKFDGVLVDAPCSGIGTWQRNPHARWTTTINDVKELAGIQLQLLQNAATSLKSGGKLVYSVCTLARTETTEVVSAFQNSVKGFEPLSFADPTMPSREPAPQTFIWPQDCGGNGMFVAAWRKL